VESWEKEKGRVRRGEYGGRVKRKRGESYMGLRYRKGKSY
jgi:hypothetical protein